MEASSDAKYFISTHEDSFRVHHLKLFFLWGHGNFGSAGAQNISAQVFMKEKNQAKTNQNKPKQAKTAEAGSRTEWDEITPEGKDEAQTFTPPFPASSSPFLYFPQFY